MPQPTSELVSELATVKQLMNDVIYSLSMELGCTDVELHVVSDYFVEPSRIRVIIKTNESTYAFSESFKNIVTKEEHKEYSPGELEYALSKWANEMLEEVWASIAEERGKKQSADISWLAGFFFSGEDGK